MKLQAIVVVIYVTVVAAAAVFSTLDQHAVPEVLQGRWVTDQANYEACYIQLTSDFVEIGTQRGCNLPGAVISIKIERDHRFQHYDIVYYDSDCEVSVLTLHYDPSGGGTLRVGSQREILWWRESDGDKSERKSTDV